MLTFDLDTQDCLINDKIGNISDIEFAQGSVWKVYVNFSDEKTVLKAVRPFYLDWQNYWVPISKNVKLRFQ